VKIAVVNCNTNQDITKNLEVIASGAAGAGTSIIGLTPPFGPESAEGYYESFVSAVGMLAALEQTPEEFDAIVLAGFGEHGREGVRQRFDVPVVDITEAAPMFANLVGHRFGVVTTLSTTLPGIWDSLRGAGLDARCVGVEASGIPVSAIHDDAQAVAAGLEFNAQVLLDRGAEAIVLGCAGFAGLDQALAERLGVPVIDGVPAAVRLAEAMVNSGLHTSKALAYRTPDPKKSWVGWEPGPTQTATHLFHP